MNDKEYWSKFAGRFEPKHMEQVLAWIDHLNSKKVLDCGCGLGHYMKAFEDCGVEADGFDISEEAIKLCPYNSIKPRIRLGSITGIPYKETYDFVLCYDLLEHLTEEEILAALSELRRVSSKYILFSICFSNDINFLKDPTHITSKYREWWEHLLWREGFRILRVPLNWPFSTQLILCEVLK